MATTLANLPSNVTNEDEEAALTPAHCSLLVVASRTKDRAKSDQRL
jgi:hypothetical protein